jgi:hypothetical protein
MVQLQQASLTTIPYKLGVLFKYKVVKWSVYGKPDSMVIGLAFILGVEGSHKLQRKLMQPHAVEGISNSSTHQKELSAIYPLNQLWASELCQSKLCRHSWVLHILTRIDGMSS